MPTVLVIDGWQIRIYLPPREHAPPHVHAVKGGSEVVIALGDERTLSEVREVYGARARDVVRAYRIVETHRVMLLREWRRHHE